MINKLKVKRIHPDAVLPKRAKEGDAAYDLVAINDGEIKIDERNKLLYIEYDTGIAIEVPEGYHTEIDARSSVTNYDLILKNCIGWVDGGYKGHLILRYWITTFDGNINEYIIRRKCKLYKKGDRIAQLKIHKTIIFPVIEVEELSKTDRAEGGFGSTGI